MRPRGATSPPQWRPTEVVAWTEHEGPGRPPKGPAAWMWTATAATLGLVLSVIFFTDALCPEHRVWVQTLALLALFGSTIAIAGLVRGWATAPGLTIGVAAIGALIGVIDAAHAPLRGGAIAVGFLVALLFSAWLAVRQLPAAAWDRQLRRELRSSPGADAVMTSPTAAEPASEEALTRSE